MICPVRHQTWVGDDKLIHFADNDCCKEACAWWDTGQPGCSLLTIAQELATIRQKDEVKE